MNGYFSIINWITLHYFVSPVFVGRSVGLSVCASCLCLLFIIKHKIYFSKVRILLNDEYLWSMELYSTPLVEYQKAFITIYRIRQKNIILIQIMKWNRKHPFLELKLAVSKKEKPLYMVKCKIITEKPF